MLPEGTYRIVQRLVDRGGNVLAATFYTTLSRKKLLWSTATVTRYGNQVDAVGEPGSATVSASASSYGRGVRLDSGSTWAGVRYAFPLKGAVAYGAATYKVLGRSIGSRRSAQGMWSNTLGPIDDAGAYHLEAIGTAYGWYTMRRQMGGRIASGRLYAEILCLNEGAGRRGFDVAKVRLVYRYAVLGY